MIVAEDWTNGAQISLRAERNSLARAIVVAIATEILVAINSSVASR
jgi:hypothetical protein